MANGLPRESIEYYTGLGQRTLVELNPNILVRDAIIMAHIVVSWTPLRVLNICSTFVHLYICLRTVNQSHYGYSLKYICMEVHSNMANIGDCNF